jgi:hypothetical protein
MASFGYLILQVCGIFVVCLYVEHLVIRLNCRQGCIIKTDELSGALYLTVA